MAVGKGKGVHQDYVEALEEERRKIQMFARELPLCLHLVDESPSHNKPDWLRSVQLWGSPEAEEPPAGGSTLRKPVAVNARKIRGAFQPFERERQALAGWFPSSSAPPVISVRNMANTFRGRGDVGPEEKEKERGELLAPAAPHRKQRRCWCPDLHGKFLRALEELGGSQAATPKQIRELMNVEGLTIDEVKSHLQVRK
ncbi:Protein PHR1-like 1 [Apostasia shenzhenica]|uniref:Protein PHR1-like 1 n=1 Tax=Apostasia shenzhenica TaxID=1088818 RepID=A0A2I0B6L2_9ASPA|nr:Protein PHR1-like 1 [Apostasia shenzhenica]